MLKDLAQKGHPLVFCTLQMGIAREVANCLPFLHIGLPQEVDSTAEVLTSPKRQPLRPAQFLSSELK